MLVSISSAVKLESRSESIHKDWGKFFYLQMGFLGRSACTSPFPTGGVKVGDECFFEVALVLPWNFETFLRKATEPGHLQISARGFRRTFRMRWIFMPQVSEHRLRWCNAKIQQDLITTTSIVRLRRIGSA